MKSAKAYAALYTALVAMTGCPGSVPDSQSFAADIELADGQAISDAGQGDDVSGLPDGTDSAVADAGTADSAPQDASS